VSLQDSILREYDLRTGEKNVELSSKYLLATLSADGKLIVEILPSEAGQNGTSFRIVKIATGNEVSRFYSDVPILATAFTFSPDGNTLVATAAQMNAVFTTFFDIQKGESLKTFNEYGKHYDFHPERRQVALASENSLFIDVFNMDTWEKEFSLGDATPIQRYFNLHYSGNGEYLFAINNLSTAVDFFDPETGDLLLSLKDKIEYISTIEISPKNDLLVSAANDGVIIWGIVPSTLADVEPGDSALTFYLSESIGWALESVDPAGSGDVQLVLRKTADGGETWEVILDPTDTAAALPGFLATGMIFADEDYGWITQDSQGFQVLVYLQVTQDGGVTWEGMEMPAPETAPDIFKDCACGLYDPKLESPQVGSVCLNCNCSDEDNYPFTLFNYRTEDGGMTWQITEKTE
jgi:WD40 repeat protein